jgi:DnaJ-class molecular chaperone
VVTGFLVDKLTQWFFDLPPTEALEKAYNTLQVHHQASNEVVNAAYHDLCKTAHPDKGGNEEESTKIRTAFLLIKASREKEMYKV